MNSRSELINKLSEVGFVMDDLRLYLDTHPHDVQAIKAYNENAKIYKMLEMEYTQNIAGFTSYCENPNENKWVWNDYPMPWEGGVR